jgi:hypothetical protein
MLMQALPCVVCGGEIEPAYDAGSRCEDCYAERAKIPSHSVQEPADDKPAAPE